MPSTIKPTTALPQRDIQIARFAALAAAIHVLEAGIPTPLPGVKLGLANIVTLIVLWRHGWRAAMAVTLLRIVLSGIVLGTLFAPTFWLSLAGGSAALVALLLGGLLHRASPSLGPSPIGVSLLASCAHIQAQFWLAWVWFVPHPGLFALLPVLQGAAIVTGLATGLLATRILNRMRELEPTLPPTAQ